MATLVEMGVAPYPGVYPKVKIIDREDARTLVDILERNGIPVNLREVSDDYVGIDQKVVKKPTRDEDLAHRIEEHKKNYPGTSLDM